MSRAKAWLLLIGALFADAAGSASAATRYDPRLKFSTISTARFDIHFHQREEAIAWRLAGFIEAAADSVDAAVGAAVGRVQVILVDQHDLSNGWATPVPYNTIEITVAAPAAGSGIGNTSDWLRLVFVHEYTHIAHLSRAGGWISGLRRGFGRQPLLFPNLYQPIWAIEGIATWQESRRTGEGRLTAGDFRAILNEASAGGRFATLDRVNGGNVDWPGGNAPYLYGASFHEFLARKYGDAAIRMLASETGARVPYFGSRAYKKVFGRSLGQLWRDFSEAAAASEKAAPQSTAARLTRHGFRVSTPRYDRRGHLYYSIANPHQFPSLMELASESAPSAGAPPRLVTTRYLGGAIGLAGDRLLIDEIEMVQSVALQSDLWLIDPRTGRRERITREARAADPDVARDGRSVVCTVQMADRRPLATLSMTGTAGLLTPEVFLSEEETDFALPRWSPDGRSIAAERRRRGGPAEIVVIDAATQRLTVMASLPGGRAGSPVWTPDGAYVLFAASVEDGPFHIYRVAARGGPVSRLEDTGRSAQSPDVSPDGRRLVFVGYTADGYDLFELRLDAARWTPVAAANARATPQQPGNAAAATPTLPAAGGAADYSPWRTLVPAFWTPTVESDVDELVIGAATGSIDSLGRHAYGIEAGWTTRLQPDWQVAYAYDRWRPTLFAAFADDTGPWRDGERRSREADAGLLLPFRRVRDSRTLLAALHAGTERFECDACDTPSTATVGRTSARAGFTHSNAHEFGYSVSAEEGGRFTSTIELSRGRAETEGSATTGNGVALTAEVRRYRRAWPRHGVIALRGAAAGWWGDSAASQVFSASGNGPQGGGFGFGSDAIGLLRGFDEDEVAGTRAAVVNADWRLPLWRIGRGLGTIPVFVRTLHGALFVDAGQAWSEPPRWADVRVAAGGELSADVVVGFALPLTVTAGVAVRRDGAGASRNATAFFRVGRAF